MFREPDKELAACEEHVGSGEKGSGRPKRVDDTLIELFLEHGSHRVHLHRAAPALLGGGLAHQGDPVDHNGEVLSEHRGRVRLVWRQLEHVEAEASDERGQGSVLFPGFLEVDILSI